MKKVFAFALLLALAAFAAPRPIFADAAEDQEIQRSLVHQFDSSKEIHARFVDRYYWDTTPEVKVEVQNGVVTLRGFVDNNLAKESYEKIARATPGVKDVILHIRVVPIERKVD